MSNQSTQPKPVAWMFETHDPLEGWIPYLHFNKVKGCKNYVPLYTAPSKWVGLTDEEFEEVLARHNEALPMVVCRAIEAKLKEKNCV